MKVLKQVALWLLIIGGLNWLGVAFGFNAVEQIFGMGTPASMLIYTLVGAAAVYKAVKLLVPHKIK